MSSNPFTLGFDLYRQSWEQAAETIEKSTDSPEQLERMAEIDVGTTPSEIVYEENKLELLHYESQTEEQHDVPILIVYALINKPYILDLQPDRSVVRTLLENGFDVYMIDWNEPSAMDASLTLEDYVDRYIENCVDVVRERSGQESINILGYCMGGTMSVMYAALHPEKVRNLGLMAAGLCFTGTGGVLEQWGDEKYYSPGAVTDAFGNVPADFLDIGFAVMDPVQNFVTKYVQLYDNIEDEEFVENFARMERWVSDGIDVAGTTYEQFLTDIYQQNKLAENELYLGEKHIDLAEIDMPVLQVVGEYDHLIPPEASKPFNELVTSEDTEVMEFSTGHIGLSVSSKSHAELWPGVCEWYAERSETEDEEPETEGESVEASEEPDAALAEDVAGDETGTEEGNFDTDIESGTDGDSEVDADSRPTSDPDADLEAISGIGPTFAERLREAGVANVGALAEADPEDLANRIGVSSDQLVEDWVDEASDHVER